LLPSLLRLIETLLVQLGGLRPIVTLSYVYECLASKCTVDYLNFQDTNA